MGRVKKKTEGYGYKYAELATVNEWLEAQGLTYYQYIKVLDDGREQVFTKRSDIEEPIPGCIVAEAKLTGKNNPAQEHGSALTYARRYSLYMAYGLATEDDDAESLNQSMLDLPEDMHTQIRHWCNRKGKLLKDIVNEFKLRGNTEEELEAKFVEIKDKYGE
jgi:hypothetical protein